MSWLNVCLRIAGWGGNSTDPLRGPWAGTEARLRAALQQAGVSRDRLVVTDPMPGDIHLAAKVVPPFY